MIRPTEFSKRPLQRSGESTGQGRRACGVVTAPATAPTAIPSVAATRLPPSRRRPNAEISVGVSNASHYVLSHG